MGKSLVLFNIPSQENIKLFLTALGTREHTAAIGRAIQGLSPGPRLREMAWRGWRCRACRLQTAQGSQSWALHNCCLPHTSIEGWSYHDYPFTQEKTEASHQKRVEVSAPEVVQTRAEFGPGSHSPKMCLWCCLA